MYFVSGVIVVVCEGIDEKSNFIGVVGFVMDFFLVVFVFCCRCMC